MWSVFLEGGGENKEREEKEFRGRWRAKGGRNKEKFILVILDPALVEQGGEKKPPASQGDGGTRTNARPESGEQGVSGGKYTHTRLEGEVSARLQRRGEGSACLLVAQPREGSRKSNVASAGGTKICGGE